jgi:hypothetical protein
LLSISTTNIAVRYFSLWVIYPLNCRVLISSRPDFWWPKCSRASFVSSHGHHQLYLILQ